METLAAAFASSAASASTAAAAAGAGSAAAGAIGASGLGFTAATGAGFGAIEGGGLLAGAAGLFEGASTLDLLQGGFTAFSALSSINAGNLQAASLENQSAFEEFAAKQEILKGRKEAIDMLEALNQTIGSNLVATAASGIRPSGSPSAAQDAAIRKGNFELDISRTGAQINAGARKAQATQLKLEAGSAKSSGVATAAGTVADTAFRIARR